MSGTEYKRIFQLARDRALSGFTMLVQCLVREAGESLAQSLSEARSALEKIAISSARQILYRDGEVFVRHSDALFRNYLERAMRTMYTDLRPELMKLSADELSLIDDETVNRQIEVDRVVLRMRNDGQENIGRLNVIIAQLHGDREARERENPFRPYLLARTLYETVKDIATDEAVARHLFEHMSNSLVRNFPAYYTNILGAFESSGIRAQFAPRLSRSTWNQRYFGGMAMAPEVLPANFSARVLPGMLRMLELVQHLPLPHGAQIADGAGKRQATLQDFIRTIFSADNPVGYGSGTADGSAATVFAPASPGLISQLNLFQSLAARGEAAGDGVAAERNQLFALHEKIGPDEATSMERSVINLMAMLFEFILEDETIPPPLRGQLGRLQIPLLKAAMLEPDLLKDADHPARQLLNRLYSAAIGCDRDTPLGAMIADEISLAARKVLVDFDNDPSIFSDALEEFESALAKQLRHAGSDIAACVAALEYAEKIAMLERTASTWLADLLSPLQSDRRIPDFIIGIWARVLAKAFLHETENAGGAGYLQYRDLLADLVWSVQEKQDSQERGALMRLLPGLVKGLKAGLEFICLPEAESRQALDQLVELHTQAMRPAQAKASQEQHSVAALRQRFALLRLDEARPASADGEAHPVPLAAVEAALADRDVSALVCIDPEALLPSEEELQFLSGLPLGVCMTSRSGNGSEGLELRLVWASPQRMLYLFKSSHDARLMVYAASSLLNGLKNGSLRPVEHAPIFERAAASLLAGVASMQNS